MAITTTTPSTPTMEETQTPWELGSEDHPDTGEADLPYADLDEEEWAALTHARELFEQARTFVHGDNDIPF